MKPYQMASKSIHNKDWEDLIEGVDNETKKALDVYDEMMFQRQQRPPIMICSSEVANVINEILNKNE